MYYTQWNRLVAASMLCSMCIQGCQSGLQVVSDEPVLKKSRATSNDEQANDQVSVPGVQSSAYHSTFVPGHMVPSMGLVGTRSEAQAITSPLERQFRNSGMQLQCLKTENSTLASLLQTRLGTLEYVCDEVPRTGKEILKMDHLVQGAGVLHQKMCVLVQTRIPEEAFGEKEWGQYFGGVGTAPSLPSDIDEILNSPCPFWPEKTVKDTHLLVLIPATVDGRAFSFDLLGELVKHAIGESRPTKYRFCGGDVRAALGAQSPGNSYWVLMTRDVLEGSRSKKYADQRIMIAALANETRLPYALPSTLEATTVILSHYVRSGERLYTDVPWTYTRCQELVDGQYPVIVGGFSSEGLGIAGRYFDVARVHDGVAGLRKL